MGLVLCNSYSQPIWTCFAFYNEGCASDPPPFEVRGWWLIQPGSCARVYADDLADLNRFWYVHADADDGSVWDGVFRRPVPLDVFGQCWGAASNAPIVVGFFELDIGDDDDHTVTFTP
jgi:uncharacterized membrane protein